jgi:hypothetical protein
LENYDFTFCERNIIDFRTISKHHPKESTFPDQVKVFSREILLPLASPDGVLFDSLICSCANNFLQKLEKIFELYIILTSFLENEFLLCDMQQSL